MNTFLPYDYWLVDLFLYIIIMSFIHLSIGYVNLKLNVYKHVLQLKC